jgi:hypothetical protein
MPLFTHSYAGGWVSAAGGGGSGTLTAEDLPSTNRSEAETLDTAEVRAGVLVVAAAAVAAGRLLVSLAAAMTCCKRQVPEA